MQHPLVMKVLQRIGIYLNLMKVIYSKSHPKKGRVLSMWARFRIKKRMLTLLTSQHVGSYALEPSILDVNIIARVKYDWIH